MKAMPDYLAAETRLAGGGVSVIDMRHGIRYVWNGRNGISAYRTERPFPNPASDRIWTAVMNQALEPTGPKATLADFIAYVVDQADKVAAMREP